MKLRASLKDRLPLPLQPASAAIAQAKYFRPGEDLDGLRRRLARALAGPEADPGRWEEAFYRVLHHAYPGGRIMANAGAEDLKPGVSTINCTVSRTIDDSMAGIMQAASEAALTLKAGCGIGYDFSSLRPRGALVSGGGADTVSCDSKRVREAPHRVAPAPRLLQAESDSMSLSAKQTPLRSGTVSRHGATTSGPLPFMDVFDAICRTVSSAGGRRGAQMGCLDIGHPDIEAFITAKRETGRLRAFNLSCLISDAFISAVRADADWPLAFPAFAAEMDGELIWRRWPLRDPGYVVNESGETACRVYRSVKARALWKLVLRSTYDTSDPGFILIDEVNRMNPLWYCEDIRAMNPCVSADTWVHTQDGPRQVVELVGRPTVLFHHGSLHATGPQGFFRTGSKPLLRLRTTEGYSLRLTADHLLQQVARSTRWVRETQWCAVRDLRPGDRIVLHDHRSSVHWGARGQFGEGYLLGLLIGDGTLKADKAVLSVWRRAAVVNALDVQGVDAVMAEAMKHVSALPHRADFRGWMRVPGRGEFRLATAALQQLAHDYGLRPGLKTITSDIERSSSDFHRGLLRGLFDADGSVQGSQRKGVSVRLAQSDASTLEAAQRMLLRLGIVSTLYRERRKAGASVLPDGRGGRRPYPTAAQHELVLSGANLLRYAELIGFSDSEKSARLQTSLSEYRRALNAERFTAEVEVVEPDGVEDVFDVQVPGVNAFDANGFVAHNCGEQPLPPFGACLLGSVNLASLVQRPFTREAHFDVDAYAQVVRVFARMLDNVVELHGLPLPEQRAEIARKRRHGMGYFGLGSALTMLGIRYGSPESVAFTERITRVLAVENWRAALELAREKGPAPVLAEDVEITPALLARQPLLARDGIKPGTRLPARVLHARYSAHLQRVAQAEPELVAQLADVGARYTHATSIAPTGTMAASVGNNASNGIEPSFAHHYTRNMIVPGEKAKRAVRMESYELLAYRHHVDAKVDADDLPEIFAATAAGTDPREHIAVQAAAQRWVDASISKTINMPTDLDFEDFKSLYDAAIDQGLKGCTTFRFNPEVHQGVLVTDRDLAATEYEFRLADGRSVRLPGDAQVEYEGGSYSAANLYDALKEGFYGKL